MKRTVALLLTAIFLTSCMTGSGHIRRRSDLMSYLYPRAQDAPQPTPERARMQLPLRLGIAVVPTAKPNMQPLTPAAEKKLLDTVRGAFQGRDWVREIVVIPSQYLMPGGGFENLDQVSRMYGVEVVALASVDQIQHTDPGMLSFLYLSVIAAYVLPLDRNDTQTLIDVAAFHVPTRTFLLRAPGSSRIKGTSTAVEQQKTLRSKADTGLQMATQDLAANLDKEVETFKASIVAGERPEIDIVNRSGESIRTSGSVGIGELAFAAALLLAIARRRR